jgi:hypothetical protein
MADSIYLWSIIFEWKKSISGFDVGPSAIAQGKTLGQGQGLGYGPRKEFKLSKQIWSLVQRR